MGTREGSNVLEVGSGLGFDAISLSRIVGSSGRVVAMDSSHRMLKAAQEREKIQARPSSSCWETPAKWAFMMGASTAPG